MITSDLSVWKEKYNYKRHFSCQMKLTIQVVLLKPTTKRKHSSLNDTNALHLLASNVFIISTCVKYISAHVCVPVWSLFGGYVMMCYILFTQNTICMPFYPYPLNQGSATLSARERCVCRRPFHLSRSTPSVFEDRDHLIKQVESDVFLLDSNQQLL